ncbi:MAG: nitrogenase component 1, partial [Eubacteriales bacterium]
MKYGKDGLHYNSPAHGDWGVVRMAMLVPESVQLFVCPFACGRHGAIGAMTQGLKDRLSYLYINQSDIISGYDDLIPPAVEEMLDALPTRPRAFFIFVSCLDDLLGTDHESILEVLSEKHPDIVFDFGHMNPISADKPTPPAISAQNNIYRVLAPTNQPTLPHINTIGNLESLAPSAELRRLLELKGGVVHHISEFSTFDSYQTMSQSQLNLVLRPVGMQAAKSMEKRLGIPFIYHPLGYRPEEIESRFVELAERLEIPAQDYQPILDEAKERGLSAVERTKALIGETPIIIDSTAVLRPC